MWKVACNYWKKVSSILDLTQKLNQDIDFRYETFNIIVKVDYSVGNTSWFKSKTIKRERWNVKWFGYRIRHNHFLWQKLLKKDKHEENKWKRE